MMWITNCAAALLAVSLSLPAFAEPTTQPATQPTTQPATQPADPAAEQWLDRIEAAAEEVGTVGSTVWWITENTLLGDRQYRQGQLLYQAEPARFRIAFDKRSTGPGGRIDTIDHTIVFTGQTLIERKGEDKVVHVYQLAREGEEVDLAEAAHGPFVLPLNLEKDRVLERFVAEMIPLREDAPQDAAVHLRLTPREGVDEDVLPMDIWFGGEHLLPLVVRTENTDAEELTEFRLRDPQVNVRVADDAFTFQEPTAPGWQVELHPFQR